MISLVYKFLKKSLTYILKMQNPKSSYFTYLNQKRLWINSKEVNKINLSLKFLNANSQGYRSFIWKVTVKTRVMHILKWETFKIWTIIFILLNKIQKMFGSNQNSASVTLQVKGISEIRGMATNDKSVNDIAMEGLYSRGPIIWENSVWY